MDNVLRRIGRAHEPQYKVAETNVVSFEGRFPWRVRYAFEDWAFASHGLQRVTPRNVQMRQMKVPQSEQG